MKRVIVRYKVKPDRADENVKLVQAVFAELLQSEPDGLRYATFQDEDGVSFTHVASIETPDDSNPLAETAAFKQFQAEIKERCEVPPQASTVTLVGSYRLMY
jgi:quinol monooxygenase YgiN